MRRIYLAAKPTLLNIEADAYEQVHYPRKIHVAAQIFLRHHSGPRGRKTRMAIRSAIDQMRRVIRERGFTPRSVVLIWHNEDTADTVSMAKQLMRNEAERKLREPYP